MKNSLEFDLLPKGIYYTTISILIIPILVILFFSLCQWEMGEVVGYSLEGYQGLFQPVRLKEIRVVITRSFTLASIATLIAFLTSYLLVRSNKSTLQSIFLLLITLPFLVNESVRIFSWQVILSEYGLANQVVSMFTDSWTTFFNSTNIYNVYAVTILGLVPFGVFINVLVLNLIDKNLWKAAKDIGASEIKIFYQIAIPLGVRGILFTLIITTFIALTLSSEVVYLAGATKQSIRILIQDLQSANKNPVVYSLGASLIIIFTIFIVLGNYILNRRK